MSRARLERLGAHGPVAPSGARHEAHVAPASRMSAALAGALLLICLYAAFAHGAVASADEQRVQLGVAVVAAAAWLWSGTLRLRAPAVVWTGVALLAGFAFWSGLTLLWSVAPDQTWSECNRAITYAIVLCLAITVGASHPRAVAIVARGLLVVCLAVTAYGLGQKLVPGLHIAGLFTLDRTGALPRLQQPLGYWNALALFVAMGVPIALATAVDRTRGDRLRLGAAGAIVAMLLTIGFTYSRGGVLALVVALALAVGLSGARLRSLLWLAMAMIATSPVLLVALNSHRLTATGVGLSTRELAGGELAAVLVACLLLLVLAGARVIALEPRVVVTPDRARRIWRGLAAAAGVLLVAAVLAVAVSARGLTGTASHAWSSFTATRATSVYDPGRLLSADSENRWVWWKEAAGAFSDRPLGGWGAGSFGVVHLLYRRDTLSVQQPHSVPLQFLAETGIVGAGLGLGALALLLIAGLRAVRRLAGAGSAERSLAVGLLAAAVAYSVHELYDWDWDIPALTIAALVCLGTLGGSLAGHRTWARGEVAGGEGGGGLAARVLGLGLAALWLSAFAVSVVLPRLASTDAQRALISASSATPSALRSARTLALRASRLDPLSDAGLRAASTISVHQGDLMRARTDLLEAVRRTPTDGSAWQELAFEDFALRDNADGLAASQRALALDPRGAVAITFAERAMLNRAPPAGSATATPTARAGSAP
jgi:O-Antigen ligase